MSRANCYPCISWTIFLINWNLWSVNTRMDSCSLLKLKLCLSACILHTHCNNSKRYCNIIIISGNILGYSEDYKSTCSITELFRAGPRPLSKADNNFSDSGQSILLPQCFTWWSQGSEDRLHSDVFQVRWFYYYPGIVEGLR